MCVDLFLPNLSLMMMLNVVSGLKSFKAINSLDFSYHAHYFHCIEPSILKNLTSLHVTRDINCDRTSELQLIKDHCRNLTSLTLRVFPKGFASMRQSLICDIIDLNPHLVTFYGSLGDTTVLSHLQQCKHLKRVSMTVARIDGSLVEALIENTDMDELLLDNHIYCYSYRSEYGITLEFLNNEPPNIAEIFNQYKSIKRVLFAFQASLTLLNTLRSCCPNIEGLSMARLSVDEEVVYSALQQFPALKKFMICGFGARSFPCEVFCTDWKLNHLKDLTLACVDMTFSKWVEIIQAYPKLKIFLLFEKFDNEFASKLVGYIQRNFQAVGRQLLFEYKHGKKTILKYENGTCSGAWLSDTGKCSSYYDAEDEEEVGIGNDI